MLENNHLKIIIILTLTLVFLIVWLILTLRSIRFQKRINNYVINKKVNEDISIIGKLEKKYLKIRRKMMKVLKKNYRNKENKEEEKLAFTCDKILISFFTLLVYFVFSLLTFTKPSILFVIIFWLLGYFIPILKEKIKYKVNRKKIEKDLLKAVSLINNSLQSGKSMIQAIKTVSQELDGPISVEFQKIEKDLDKGLSLSLAFDRFRNRVNLEEADYIMVSLLILNQTGGNIISVFKSLEESFYIRRKLDNELQATIASSKLLFQILIILPFLIYLLIGMANPNYFTIFFKSTTGILVFLIIILIYLLYVIVIKNIMKIEKY